MLWKPMLWVDVKVDGSLFRVEAARARFLSSFSRRRVFRMDGVLDFHLAFLS